MRNNTDIRHGRHCVFNLHVHLVFVTKYRRGVFTKEVINDLREIFTDVCTDFEAELVEFDGEDDPVHLLVNDPVQGRGVGTGKQSERRFKQNDPQKKLP